jgi:hypothetical protein
LTAVAAVAAAVMMALNVAAEPAMDSGLGGQTASPASCDGRFEMEPADVECAVQLGQEKDLLEPAAICRLRPQCMTNSDCDGLCGEGLGKCVRSKCPVRICRCRLH